MTYRKAVGRPLKVDHKVITELVNAIQTSSNITDACRYAGISRDTFYRHMSNKVFAEKMKEAYNNQNKVVFSFLTPFQIN
jgi:ACT domain-containing protein